MRNAIILLAASVLIALPAQAAAPAPPPLRQLANHVTLVAPLSGSSLLYADDDGAIWLLDAATGKRSAWHCSWTPQADGWDHASRVVVLKRSPDGRWVCFAREVGADIAKFAQRQPVDGTLAGQEQFWAVAVVLARADGSGAHAVALGQEAGGGPDYDFTQDSVRLVGQPFEPCLPDAQHCYDYGRTIWEVPPLARFNYIDVASGERGLLDDLPVSDGYWKCPYSDYFRAENNDYDVHQFSSFDGGGITGEYTCPPPANHGAMLGWVLEDAVLLAQADGQGLLYVDGTFRKAPQAVWDVRCWLPDGTYIFSDGAGATLKYGKLDWNSFSVDWAVARPDLVQYIDAHWQALADSSGVLIQPWDTGELYFALVSRASARP